MGDQNTSKSKKIMKITGLILLVVLVFLVLANFIQVKKNETLLYKIQQYMTYNQADWENYEYNQALLAKNPALNIEVTDVSAGTGDADLYPVDTNNVVPGIKAAEVAKIKKANFKTLKAAENPPQHGDAESALIRFTSGRLTEVIRQQQINVKIGTCFENSNTEGNYRCVSCMILLYNRSKKDWVEAPDGDNFLKNAYDFYQPSQGDIWEAKELSIRIPFDYALYREFTGTAQ